MIERSKQIIFKLVREHVVPLSNERRRMNEKEKEVDRIEAELEEARETFKKAQDEYHQELSAFVELIQLSEFPINENSTMPTLFQAFRIRQSNDLTALMWDILGKLRDE